MTDSIEARVARGAAWLDENEPGWERRVEVNELRMKDGCRCVLGYVFREDAQEGAYGNDGFNYAVESNRYLYDHTAELGFDCYCSEDSEYGYAALSKAWMALLKERFASGTLSDEA